MFFFENDTLNCIHLQACIYNRVLLKKWNIIKTFNILLTIYIWFKLSAGRQALIFMSAATTYRFRVLVMS